jgi:hypothetical protein
MAGELPISEWVACFVASGDPDPEISGSAHAWIGNQLNENPPTILDIACTILMHDENPQLPAEWPPSQRPTFSTLGIPRSCA